ncbi:hypothetical protein BJX62DRAFT_236683 [Aspergillus germanicus]
MAIALNAHHLARQSALRNDTRNAAIVFFVVAGICISLAAFAVAIRLYIRFRITRNPWWDDATTVVALISEKDIYQMNQLLTRGL